MKRQQPSPSPKASSIALTSTPSITLGGMTALPLSRLAVASASSLLARRATVIAGPSRPTPTLFHPFHTSSTPHAAIRAPPPRPGQRPPPPANPMSLRDAQIPYPSVQVVSAADNSLSPPTPLRIILDSYDHSTHTLTLVSLDPPIVKLLDKEGIRQKARVAEVKARLNRKTAVEEKEVQVSWASALGDLKHKLAAAKSALERGDRATVIYASKAGSEKVSGEQQAEITSMFEKELEDMAVRWKEDEKSKGTWIQFWGPMAKVREERRAKVQEEEVGKRKERDEKKEARRRKEEERLAKAKAARGE